MSVVQLAVVRALPGRSADLEVVRTTAPNVRGAVIFFPADAG